MNILLFFVVLGVLIFVHELGHFLWAKFFGVRVDEFGFGYPPLLLSLGTWKGTRISLNWIPFGGFVKLFGQSDDGELSEDDKKVSLVHKPRYAQFLIMGGGILFNIIFAWMLLTVSYMGGIQASVSSFPQDSSVESSELVITSVMPNSPAQKAGLMAGDVIKEYLSEDQTVTVSQEGIDEFASFVNDAGSKNQEILLVLTRGESIKQLSVRPQEGIVEGAFGIGIGADRIAELRLSFFSSLALAANNTWHFLGAIFVGFGQLITGEIPLDAVSGPVGIVGQVGEASSVGWSYLLSFTALLSLNLAVLNILPFPALDGGRMLILIIESIIRRPLPTPLVNGINLIGFFLLIALMLWVTVKDIINLF